MATYVDGQEVLADIAMFGTWTAVGTVKLPALTLNGAIAGGSQNITGLGTINGLAITANTGAITTGSWTATVISPVYGGTGVANNVASTLTITGAYTLGLTISNTTAITLPTTGTLATLAGAEAFTNKTISVSDVTVGAGKTLDVSAGTLTLANNQISGDKVEGGTIAAITITALTAGVVTATKAGGIAGSFTITGPQTNQALNAVSFRAESSGTMADGFAVQILYYLKDVDLDNLMGWWEWVRDGADNTAKVNWQIASAGSFATRLSITAAGVLNVTGSYTVAGTKVVGARIVDARCDDAINSGDATTDGVIDSLRDAMITHGLVAAA